MRLTAEPRGIEDNVEQQQQSSCSIVDEGDYQGVKVAHQDMKPGEHQQNPSHAVKNSSAKQQDFVNKFQGAFFRAVPS